MADTIADIQRDYVEELRHVAPDIRVWWDRMLIREGEDATWFRWPTGPSGHPRIIAIFRKHYFRIEELNRESKALFPGEDPELREVMWGHDDSGDAAVFERHVDRLILDIASVAPDIADLVDGLCLVPVGINQGEAPV
jgi:hypothetical protein